MRLPWLIFGVSEVTILTVNQIDAMPDNLLMILVNLPVVALVVWLQLQNQKWLEHMLDVQRQSLKSIYEGQSLFLNTLLAQVEVKQNRVIDHLEQLTRTTEILRGTVSEVAKVDDVIDRLLIEIRGKK